MTLQKAHEIIQEYGKLLGEANNGQLFQSRQKLPCSTARIKFAIYRYILELIRTGSLSKEVAASLIIAYGHLAFFTSPWEAQKLNLLTRTKGNIPAEIEEEAPELEKRLREMNYHKELLNLEIQEFIQECIDN